MRLLRTSAAVGAVAPIVTGALADERARAASRADGLRVYARLFG